MFSIALKMPVGSSRERLERRESELFDGGRCSPVVEKMEQLAGGNGITNRGDELSLIRYFRNLAAPVLKIELNARSRPVKARLKRTIAVYFHRERLLN